MRMTRSDGGDAAQAFPLQAGLCDVTTGTVTNVKLIHCVADGNLVINWDTPETISFVAGDDYGIVGAASVEVSSGTFHLAK